MSFVDLKVYDAPYALRQRLRALVLSAGAELTHAISNEFEITAEIHEMLSKLEAARTRLDEARARADAWAERLERASEACAAMHSPISIIDEEAA